MLLRAIRPFAQHPAVGQIVVALPAEQVERPPDWLAQVAGERLRIVGGGATRAASVRAALRALDPGCTIVLVHDAARPFVSADTIDRVIAVARRGVCAVPAVKVSDTLKRVDPATDLVQETVDRRFLWRAQTPQGFPRGVLEEAHAKAQGVTEDDATDDAQLVERLGHPTEIVPDSPDNLKVTTSADFLVAEAIAAR